MLRNISFFNLNLNVTITSFYFSDVFHRECLNSWAEKFPAHTAPAGYKCPVCSEKIFPPPNLESPVAHALKECLSNWSWARVGLGLPLVRKILGLISIKSLHLIKLIYLN